MGMDCHSWCPNGSWCMLCPWGRAGLSNLFLPDRPQLKVANQSPGVSIGPTTDVEIAIPCVTGNLDEAHTPDSRGTDCKQWSLLFDAIQDFPFLSLRPVEWTQVHDVMQDLQPLVLLLPPPVLHLAQQFVLSVGSFPP